MITPSLFEKQPYEEETIYIDWSNRIASGDSISTYEVKIYDAAAADQSTTMLGTPSLTGNKVYVKVKAGTDGQTYRLRCKVVTTAGDKKEVDLSVLVTEK